MTHVDKLISEATIVRPGDTLVIAVNATLTPEEFAVVNQKIKEQLPEGVASVVMAGPVQLSVLRGGAT